MILDKADCFYTISPSMQKSYKMIFVKDSVLAVNMIADLKLPKNHDEFKEEIRFVYAGSFYYKRSDVIGRLASVILKYNNSNPTRKAKLLLYSNYAA